MNENIELRDFFAGQIMSSNVDKFHDAARRKNIAKKQGDEEWVHLTSAEATQERIDDAAKMAYRIADALLKVRAK